MARNFNGSSDKLRAAIGGCNFVGDVTLAAIIKTSARDAAWRNVVTALTSAGAPSGWSMEIDNGNHLEFSNLTTNDWYTGVTITVADGWTLVAVTKATGTNRPRFHTYKYATHVFTHAAGDGGGNVTNGTAPGAGGFVDLGGDAGGSLDWFPGDMAIAGVWNRNLSDAEIENLPFTLQAWHTNPAGLWLLDQSATGQKVVDLSGGGANESSITGTSVSTASVPVFNITDGIWVPTIVAPAAGAITVNPTAATLNLTAAAPTLKTAAKPAAGLLTLSAAAPTLKAKTSTTAGLLTLGAATPTLKTKAATSAALLTLGAAAPTLKARTAAPAALLTLSAATATVNAPIKVTTTAGLLTLGAAPATLKERVAPAKPLITLGAAPPKLAARLTGTAGLLTLATTAPTVSGSIIATRFTAITLTSRGRIDAAATTAGLVTAAATSKGRIDVTAVVA